MCRLSRSRSKSMGQMLSSSSLLFNSLLYLPAALPDLEIITAVLHSLMSLNQNCSLMFNFSNDALKLSISLGPFSGIALMFC